MLGNAEMGYRIAELERRLANVMRSGSIAEADYAAARVRVQYAEYTAVDGQINPVKTAWLPWVTHRAGATVEWWAPEVGEQVIILSPSGELAQGVVLPALYSTSHPAPSSDPKVRRTNYSDGSFVEYDETSHKMTVTVNGGDVALNTTGNLNAVVDGNADIAATGDANVSAGGNVNVDGTEVLMNQGASGGVVCQQHTCSFTGSPHPQGSATVKAGG